MDDFESCKLPMTLRSMQHNSILNTISSVDSKTRINNDDDMTMMMMMTMTMMTMMMMMMRQ